MRGRMSLAYKLFPDAIGDVNHHITSTALYFASRALDYASTIAGIREMERMDNAGIQHGYGELNPFLPRRPKVSDLFSPKSLGIEAAAFAVISLIPWCAYGVSVGGFLTSASNYDIARRIRNDIEVLESKELQEELYNELFKQD